MNIFYEVADKVTRAIDSVVEANRKAALINRVKLVVKSEEKSIDKAYIALGKYYYLNLRDEKNEETEPYCAAVDRSKKRLDRALTKLEELTLQDSCYSIDDQCDDCGSDCDDCPYYEDFDSQAGLDDLRRLDGFDTGAAQEDEEPAAECHPEFLQKNVVYNHEEAKEAADEEDAGRIPSGEM